MNRKDKRPSWILPYTKRSQVSRKLANTMKQIKQCRNNGDWECVKMLSRLIRNAWWGVKRYKDK